MNKLLRKYSSITLYDEYIDFFVFVGLISCKMCASRHKLQSKYLEQVCFWFPAMKINQVQYKHYHVCVCVRACVRACVRVSSILWQQSSVTRLLKYIRGSIGYSKL